MSQRWTEQDVMAHNARMNKGKSVLDGEGHPQPAVKPSKYRNVHVVVDGEKFDSKREAQHWQELKLREKIGEITGITRQVDFPLRTSCDIPGPDYGTWFEVARYRADFVFYTVADNKRHVIDVKGHRTQMYQLKKKWLELQSGIVIEEIG